MFVDKDNGINSAKDLNGYFINRISHILKNHKLTLGAWNDGISHDSVNRFLLRENYTPKDLLKDTEGKIDKIGGVNKRR